MRKRSYSRPPRLESTYIKIASTKNKIKYLLQDNLIQSQREKIRKYPEDRLEVEDVVFMFVK